RSAGRLLLVALAVCLLVIAVVPATGGVTLALGRLRLLRVHDLTLPVNLLPVLALGWVALEGRRRREGALNRREWVATLVFLTVLMYLLTRAPTIKIADQGWGTAPFAWVFRYAPGGSAFRAPGRWSLVFVVPLALLAGAGAASVAGALRGAAARAVPIALLAGVMVECLDVPV